MNRTKQTIKGALISTAFLLGQMILQFWRVKVIITVYGTDLNSITQAASQAYAYLSLLESGLCASFQYKMYKPFAEGKFDILFGLYRNLSITMKKIGLKMFVLVIAISTIYPFILADNSISRGRAGLIFLLIGIRTVLPYYFLVSKKNILIVEEKQYIVSTLDSLTTIVTTGIELFLILVTKLVIEYTLISGCVVLIISNYIYKLYITRFWDGHKVTSCDASETSARLSDEANKMTKDILVHQICSLANSNIDILILSAINVFYVTVYANYNSIMNYPVNLVNNIIRNMRATIGLKFATNSSNSYSIFREMLALNTWAAGIVSGVFFVMINDFINVWLGERFLLPQISVGFFTLILLRRMVAETVISVRDANGLYKESKYYTLTTAVANLLLSLIFVRIWGINGILFATVITAYIIMDFGNVRLVMNAVFHASKASFYKDILLIILTIICSYYCTNAILKNLYVQDWLSFFTKTIICTVITSLVITLLLRIFDVYYYSLVKRIYKAIKLKNTK